MISPEEIPQEFVDEVIHRGYERLFALARCSETPQTLTRTFASDAMRGAADLLGGWMSEAGLQVERDDWLNLFGRTTGEKRRVLVLGSHYDTVRHAGIFDGSLGILASLCAVECIGSERIASWPFDIEVAAFSEEEGVRFATTYLGSRAAWGEITAEDLEQCDAAGIPLRDIIPATSQKPIARYDADSVLAFVESHIEQGPVLETSGHPLGVVTAVAGQNRVRVSIEGVSGHAGTCPMHLRRDALAGAAQWVCMVERLAAGEPGLVATVGCLDIPDAASNVIPGLVRLSLDVRHEEDSIRRSAIRMMHESLKSISKERELEFIWEEVLEQNAQPLDAYLQEALVKAVSSKNCPRLVSGAGHDAVVFAPKVPAGMLFVRCRGGVSHHADEFTSKEDFAELVHTLIRFLVDFAEDSK